MLEKIKAVLEVVEKVPHDLYAVAMIALGALLTLCHEKEAGYALITTGAGIFKGKA